VIHQQLASSKGARARREKVRTVSARALRVSTVLIAAAIAGLLAAPALATPAGPTMPWDQPLTVILGNLQGTVARILVTVAVVVTGLMFAFGEAGGAFRRVFGIAFGAAIALGALSVLSSLGFVGATF